MNRRDFLKAGLASAVLLMITTPFQSVLAAAPLQTTVRGKTYRGTSKGEVFVSTNGGKTWKLLTHFGAALPILSVTSNLQGQVLLKVGYKSHSFPLALANNGKDWLVGKSLAV